MPRNVSPSFLGNQNKQNGKRSGGFLEISCEGLVIQVPPFFSAVAFSKRGKLIIRESSFGVGYV